MSQTSQTLQTSTPADPKGQGPKPDYPQRPIEPPGLDSEMTPAADHGEQSYQGLGRLRNRVALITGAGSGVGRATARIFAEQGARVALADLAEAGLRETAALVEAAGGECLLSWSTSPPTIPQPNRLSYRHFPGVDQFQPMEVMQAAGFGFAAYHGPDLATDAGTRTWLIVPLWSLVLAAGAWPAMRLGTPSEI